MRRKKSLIGKIATSRHLESTHCCKRPRRSAAAERFDYLALPRLGDDAAHEVLLQPALNLGVRWSVPALDEVLRIAAGNPFMLQKLGHESWLAAAPTRPGDTITLDHIHAGYAATATGLAHGMFRGRWAKATPVEQALLTAMAAVVDADGNVTTVDLVTLTGRTTPQWSTARRSLIDKGLIEPAGHGILRFTMPTFPDFVRDLTGLDHTTPTPATITTPPEHLQLDQRPNPTQRP